MNKETLLRICGKPENFMFMNRWSGDMDKDELLAVIGFMQRQHKATLDVARTLARRSESTLAAARDAKS